MRLAAASLRLPTGATASLLLLAAAAAVPHGIAAAQDPFPMRVTGPVVKVEHVEADFGAYRTYAWLPSPQRAENLAHHIRISQAVEKALEGKGLEQPEDEVADLLVHYRLSTGKQTRSTPRTEQSRWDPNDRRTMVDIKRVNTGKLSIALIDGKTRERVWEGEIEYDVTTPDLELEQHAQNVESILSEFPPPPQEEQDEPRPED